MEGNMTDGMMMMKMYFHASDSATILFYGWHTSNWAELFGSCIAVFLFASLNEGLTALRLFVQTKFSSSKEPINESTELQTVTIIVEEEEERAHHQKVSHCSAQHLLQSSLYMIQTFLRFSLMLVAMTFNIWLILAVVLGSGTGFFFFQRPQRIVVRADEQNGSAVPYK